MLLEPLVLLEELVAAVLDIDELLDAAVLAEEVDVSPLGKHVTLTL